MSSSGAITRYQIPPKLPLPAQKDCFKSYLDDLSAIVSAEEWQRARDLTDKFLSDGGLGQQLHQRLEEFAEKSDNWVSFHCNHNLAKSGPDYLSQVADVHSIQVAQ